MSNIEKNCEAWAQIKPGDQTSTVVRCGLDEGQHLAVHAAKIAHPVVSQSHREDGQEMTIYYSWPGEFTDVPARGKPRDPKSL